MQEPHVWKVRTAFLPQLDPQCEKPCSKPKPLGVAALKTGSSPKCCLPPHMCEPRGVLSPPWEAPPVCHLPALTLDLAWVYTQSPSLLCVRKATTARAGWEHLSEQEQPCKLERGKYRQLQATGNLALINTTSYSQKEEINSTSTGREKRREEHSVAVVQESLHYSELIFTDHHPSLLCVPTAKISGGVGTGQREGLYQKLSTAAVIKEAARAHTT